MTGEVPPGWRIIERAGNEIDARLIAGHLQDAGIKVVLEKDNSGYGDYLYGGSNPNAPVALLVPEAQWDAATAVLDEVSVELTSPLPPTEAEWQDAEQPDAIDEEESDRDRFYLGRAEEDAVLAAPARTGLRWILVALIILILGIAAFESGFFSDLIGV